MTRPDPWPPSEETLAELSWSAGVLAAVEGPTFHGTNALRAAEFLKDERLAAALALWEAVEWVEKNNKPTHYDRAYGGWTVTGMGMESADTLPEAVTALKARLNPEKQSHE